MSLGELQLSLMASLLDLHALHLNSLIVVQPLSLCGAGS